MRMLAPLSLTCLLTLSLPALAGGSHGHEEDQHSPHEETITGPHGGLLLEEDEITVEILKSEQGGLATMQAWVTRAGKAVNELALSATLTRLGGDQETVRFRHEGSHWLGQQKIRPPHSFDISLELMLGGQRHEWQWESYEGRAEISEAAAKKAGIVSQEASGGAIDTEIQAYGRLTIPPERRATLHARFPGLVTSVKTSLGDAVTKGDVLAVVESNDSLRAYSLRAPFDGVIQQRHANAGEVTGQEALFTLINTDTLWAELTLFPQQRGAVQAGQPVTLQSGERQFESRITSLTPSSRDAPVATVIARVAVDNGDDSLVPGDLVDARIVIASEQVPLRVDNRALQEMNGSTVVFLHAGNAYESRTVTLGRRDNRFSEVLDGLKPGDHYVVENSYLIKADILKAGAAHHH
ncbi:efflux RND transporter periplasmic adaptor subunit [Alloalcanivorax xenomutans]|uniref:efflux RND transporter periplasmic adaptor subunit n=1 Tax=Alloalcanivorax xenomutans TaxID=1094342 RepID=UPI000BC4E6AC|nr:HlyD family efflux transporter periplasmic adaptor subunit [Alloalcanivorax xenomutans]SOC26510.1 cobalt-zinc-cadmium efflux system membrane fusion protein [Alloalcanivorax xenomutans]